MPFAARSLRITDSYRARVMASRSALQIRTRQLWPTLENFDGDQWIERIAFAVSERQRVSVDLTRGYLAAYLSSEFGTRQNPPQIPSEKYVGLTPSGDTIVQALNNIREDVRFELRNGVQTPVALRNGLIRAERYMGMTYDFAHRTALVDAIAEDQRMLGWKRAVRGTCGACAAAASDTVSKSLRFEVHPSCQCVSEPAVRDGKPQPDTNQNQLKKAVEKYRSERPVNVEVSDLGQPDVQEAVADFYTLPESLRDALNSVGIKLKIGNRTLAQLGFAPSRKTARGVGRRRSWDEVSGVFSPSQNTAFVATKGRGASSSPALHELGHAIDHELKRDLPDGRGPAYPGRAFDYRDWHRKLYDRLPPYLQGGKPGSVHGSGELFAEAFATLVKNPQKAVELYGQEYVDWLQEQVRLFEDGQA